MRPYVSKLLLLELPAQFIEQSPKTLKGSVLTLESQLFLLDLIIIIDFWQFVGELIY